MTQPPRAAAPAPFRCGGCRRVLGLGWADRLEVGPAAFRKHVTIECIACGGRNRWYPSAQAGAAPAQNRPVSQSGVDAEPSPAQNAPHTRTE